MSVSHPWRTFESGPDGVRQKLYTYKSTQDIREHADSKQMSNTAGKNQQNKHTHSKNNNLATPTNMSRQHMTMNIGNLKNKYAKKQQGGSRDSQQNRNGASLVPPPVVETVGSSSQSQTSSIGIGEFGMNPAHRGNAAAFSMAVKDNLFPKLKFLQGTNASLDFSMDSTSICGYLRICCGVSEVDACQWWDDHRMMLKNIHTDCRNNKIKMVKQQFNGKFREYVLICQT
jgi:hypothetical protein